MAKKQSTGFGQRLRALRDAAGFTQAQLAAMAGLHVMGLAKIEHGQREPSWSTVVALARALNVGVEAFLPADGDLPAVEEPPRARGRPKKAPDEGKESRGRKARG